MTAKRYQIFVNRKKFDYTYDAETGVLRTKLPGMTEFITTRSPNPSEARLDMRQMVERAIGETARLAAVRKKFLRDILNTNALGPLVSVTEDNLAAALARVSDALSDDQRRVLGIKEPWRKRIAHANAVNDASLISPVDAAALVVIASEIRDGELRE